MIYKSRAPLRIGFAGGGTDVSPYSEIYGGAVVNATISLYANVSVEPVKSGEVTILADGKSESIPVSSELEINGHFDLAKAVYNHFTKNFSIPQSGVRILINVDVPHGSGLGTSSTLVVALVGAFSEMAGIKLNSNDIASLAYEIERTQLKWAGGRQDQYAASFGGFNLLEFQDNITSVTPLEIKAETIDLLEQNLLLFYTGISRNSADIIRQQTKSVEAGMTERIAFMHKLKEEVFVIRQLLESSDLSSFGEIMDKNFIYKKNMAEGISNPYIDSIYSAAVSAGATGGKISGAGGGGFLLFYCPNGTRLAVEEALKEFPGFVQSYNFEKQGLKTWIEKH